MSSNSTTITSNGTANTVLTSKQPETTMSESVGQSDVPNEIGGHQISLDQQIPHQQQPPTMYSQSPYVTRDGLYMPQGTYVQPPQQPPPTGWKPVAYYPSAQGQQYNPQKTGVVYPQQFQQQQSQDAQNPNRGSRGPKPVVPPRINSKITYDGGQRKTVNFDPAKQDQGQKSDPGTEEQPTRDTGSNNNQVSNGEADPPYVTKGDMQQQQQQKISDAITFKFPNDGSNQHPPPQIQQTMTLRRPVPNLNNSDMRMSPMPGLPPIWKPVGERKSVEWSSLSPNQRTGASGIQENRRSDYFDDHRRSPMRGAGAGLEEVRRSPVVFVPIDKTNPPVQNNFEKTRQELALWAEQRQRQEQQHMGSRLRTHSEERRPMHQVIPAHLSQSAFQPIANITPSSIIEQRRHLRHISADLTKNLDFGRKEFDDQPLNVGSVSNLGPTRLNANNLVDVNNQQNHRKNYSSVTNTPIHVRQDNPQQPRQVMNGNNSEDLIPAQHFHNLQSLDFITEKLSQCEKQQSDLQAKLMCLQNQNEILDKVAQYQHQNDMEARMQCLQLQNQMIESYNRKQQQQQHQINPDHLQYPQTHFPNHVVNNYQCRHGQLLNTAGSKVMMADRLSPHLSNNSAHHDFMSECLSIPNIPAQLSLSNLTQLSNKSYSQRYQQGIESFDNILTNQMGGSNNFSGTMKKVPPEKPPRTSLIVQSPENEVSRIDVFEILLMLRLEILIVMISLSKYICY